MLHVRMVRKRSRKPSIRNDLQVQILCAAPLCPHTQVWLKRVVLKTTRPGNRRGGSNPPAGAALRRKKNADVGEWFMPAVC